MELNGIYSLQRKIRSLLDKGATKQDLEGVLEDLDILDRYLTAYCQCQWVDWGNVTRSPGDYPLSHELSKDVVEAMDAAAKEFEKGEETERSRLLEEGDDDSIVMQSLIDLGKSSEKRRLEDMGKAVHTSLRDAYPGKMLRQDG